MAPRPRTLIGDPNKVGFVYFLWAEGTNRFKIGFTRSDIDKRALAIMNYSPVPIRIQGVRFGSRHDEAALHSELKDYRLHSEWFELPEPVVWRLLRWFGALI